MPPSHPDPTPRVSRWRRSWLPLGLILFAFLLSAYSSSRPDGLEAVVGRLGLEEPEPVFSFSLETLLSREWLARLLGVVAAGVCGWWLSRLRWGKTRAGGESSMEGRPPPHG